HRIENILRLEPRGRERLGRKLNLDGRRAALALELKIDDPRYSSQRSDDFIAGRVERVQIIAHHLDGHLRGFTAQTLADAIAQKGHDLALDAGVARQYPAQLLFGDTLIDLRIRL